MKMMRRFLLIVCATALFASSAIDVLAVTQADQITYNRYNIVLVTDASGSMRDTDGDGLRFEAIGKFVALLAERGNRVGSVVFNDGIAFKQEMMDVGGLLDKRDIIDNISDIPARGDTNIGLALQTAVDMLDAGNNPDLPSIILFFSDGNTDMPTNEERKLSLEQKADAIQAARDAGYRIYTISLNADGSADSEELRQIARATNGQFEEVKRAGDLEKVFAMFYSLIFSSKLEEGEEEAFPASGIINGSFEVPGIGVEEVNIVLSGRVTDYSVTDPAGRNYAKDELSLTTFATETFHVIKIVDPMSGTWNYSLKGNPGDKIQINIVFNTNLSAGMKVTPEQDSYYVNDAITVNAFLALSGTPVEKQDYIGFHATMSITDNQGNAESFDMSLGDIDGFVYEFIPPASGTYTLEARIVGQIYELETESIQINIGNTPPIWEQDIYVTIRLWPFSSNDRAIDLTPGAVDAQDSSLRYEVESSSFLEQEYSMQGHELFLKSADGRYSLTKGSFTIRAYDSEGAYATFEVFVTTINMMLVGTLILVGGILLFLIISSILLWIALNKRFMGTCYVMPFDDDGNYYEEIKREKGRGRLPLSSFTSPGASGTSVLGGWNNFGFHATKCYFQASGKDYAYFCTDEKAYGDGLFDNKFRLEGNGYDVTISTDELGQKGIRVRFESRLYKDRFSW